MALRSAIATLHNRALRLPWQPECWSAAIESSSFSSSSGAWHGGLQACQPNATEPDSVQTSARQASHAPSLLGRKTGECTRRTSSSLGVVSPAPLNLNDVVVLESVQKLPPEDIAVMWNSFYADKSAEISWTLQRDQWQKLKHRMKESKMSVLPVHKEPDPAQASRPCFVTILCQAQMPKTILMTPLASFQQHAAEARPSVVATFYADLAESKNIVLGRADILDGAVMSKPEAMRLVDDLMLCYMDDALYHHISLLNQSNPDFDFDVFMDRLSQHQKQ